MADIAARREARRRRILENSESRLQKISGQTSQNDEILPPPPAVPNTLGLSENIFASAPETHVPWTPTPEIDHQDFERKIQQIQNEIFGENGLFSLASGANSPGDTNLLNLLANANNGNNILPHQENKKTIKAENFDKQCYKTIIYKLICGSWIYVLLAAIVNLMMVLQVEHFFGTSILIPFIVIFISRVWLFQSLQQAQDSSMLMAALILCNIRPELIHLLKSILKISSIIFKELSLYVFSFVLIYNFVSRHWLNLEELVDKSQVIVDHSREL